MTLHATSFPDLQRLIAPRNIAVVGASARESSQGKRLLDNIVAHSAFDGGVFLVNPSYPEIGKLRCWPSIAELPDHTVDVALIIVNAALVLGALEQCVQRHIPFAIVMTSGFAETGDAGKALEQQISDLCQRSGLHVYGPNCPGFVNIGRKLGMTFSPAFKDDLNAGPIGLATQGGGLGRNVLQGLNYGLGVKLWFSAGNEADLSLPDFIAHMAADPEIKVIAVLMEGVKDGRRLVDALKLAQQHGKPVVVLKIGRSAAGIAAAQSHTASIAGSAAVNSAAFRQFGAIEVDDLDELVAVSRLLAQALPKPGADLCIYTFSGGTAALAADIAGATGVPLAKLSDATEAALRKLLPAFANIANPVDTTADVLRDADMAAECLRIVCRDEHVGTVLFPIPMDYGPITEAMAATIIEVAASAGKLVVPVWMSRRLGAGYHLLEKGGLLPFLSLTKAVAALEKIYRHLGQLAVDAPPAIHAAAMGADAPRRTILSEVAAKARLQAAGLRMPARTVATSAEEAGRLAAQIGFPVVMKVVSAQIPHKTEAGGVVVGVASGQAASTAFQTITGAVLRYRPDALIDGILVEEMLPRGGQEMLVGVHRDEVFGLVLTFGAGGVFVEVLKDVVHRVVPVSLDDARNMIGEIRSHALLQGVRGQPPADVEALAQLIVQISDFAQANAASLQELDLNPVWVGAAGQGAVALDALLVLDAGAEANADTLAANFSSL